MHHISICNGHWFFHFSVSTLKMFKSVSFVLFIYVSSYLYPEKVNFFYKLRCDWVTEKQAIPKYKLSRYKFCVHVFVTFMSVWFCSIVCVEVRRRLTGFSCLLPPNSSTSSEDGTCVARLVNKHFNMLDHLPGPI